MHHLAVPSLPSGYCQGFPPDTQLPKICTFEPAGNSILLVTSHSVYIRLSLCGAVIKLEVVQSQKFHLQAKTKTKKVEPPQSLIQLFRDSYPYIYQELCS